MELQLGGLGTVDSTPAPADGSLGRLKLVSATPAATVAPAVVFSLFPSISLPVSPFFFPSFFPSFCLDPPPPLEILTDFSKLGHACIISAGGVSTENQMAPNCAVVVTLISLCQCCNARHAAPKFGALFRFVSTPLLSCPC